MHMDKNVCMFRTFTCRILRNGVHDTRKPSVSSGNVWAPLGAHSGTEWSPLAGSMTVTGILTHNIWFGFQILCCFVWLLFILLKACLCCFVFILCSVPSLVAWEEDKPSWMFLAVPLLCQVCKGCRVFPSHPRVCQSDPRRQPLDLCLTCVS